MSQTSSVSWGSKHPVRHLAVPNQGALVQPGGCQCGQPGFEVTARQNAPAAPGVRSNSDSWRTRGESPTPPPPLLRLNQNPQALGRGTLQCSLNRKDPGLSPPGQCRQPSCPGVFMSRAVRSPSDELWSGHSLMQAHLKELPA